MKFLGTRICFVIIKGGTVNRNVLDTLLSSIINI